MTRVRVCDDHLIVRNGIKQILADAAEIEVAAEAATGPVADGFDAVDVPRPSI